MENTHIDIERRILQESSQTKDLAKRRQEKKKKHSTRKKDKNSIDPKNSTATSTNFLVVDLPP
jgi:hypothetical protein